LRDGQIFASRGGSKLVARWTIFKPDKAMHFRLTPPGTVIFFVSLILAVAAVAAAFHMHLPLVGHYVAAHRFWVMTSAYAVLLAGVIFEGL
jgi:hypothetical protein